VTFRALIKTVLAAALGVIAPAWALFGSRATAEAPSYREGTQLFLSRCATCHARTAGEQSSLGPSLFGLAERAASRVSGLNGAEYVVQSLFAPAAYVVPGYPPVMPSQLLDDVSDEDLRSLIGYLLSLGGAGDPEEIASVALPKRTKLPPFRFDRLEMESAESLFWGKGRCWQCHSTHADVQDGSMAPRIFHVGLTEAKVRAALHTHPAAPETAQLVAVQLASPVTATNTESDQRAVGAPTVHEPSVLEGVLLRDEPTGLSLLAGPWPPHELTVDRNRILSTDPAAPSVHQFSHPPEALSVGEIDALVKLILILN
jgi:mono/diheme cytochrome c family protein